MSLVTRTQYTTDTVPYPLDYRLVCLGNTSAVVRTVASVATPTHTTGVTIGTVTNGDTTVTVPVSGGADGVSYNIRVTTTFSDGTALTYEWIVAFVAPTV